MTATTNNLSSTGPSRTPLIAALGVTASAALTAVGTFWDVNNKGNSDTSGWLITLGIIAVAATLVFGLVVRTAESGNPGRRSVVLAVVGLPSVIAFWSGLPMVLVSAAVACALIEHDKTGRYGTGSKVAFALSALITVAAVSLAITG
jgi:chromate transport protein ChrA